MATGVPVNGSEIRRRRGVKGLTQRQLAVRAGIALGAVKKAEQGGPSIHATIASIAGVLRCDVGELVTAACGERPTLLSPDNNGRPQAARTESMADNRVDRAGPPKYYLYLSETKLSMLWPQVPMPAINMIAHELELDPKAVDSSARIRVLVEYIRRRNGIGTIDESTAYFGGQLEMASAILAGDADNYVYFGASTTTRAVALVGSAANAIGRLQQPQTTSSRWFSLFLLPNVLAAFEEVVGERAADFKRPVGGQNFGYYVDCINACDVVEPSQCVEFVAKRLCSNQGAILGTPLYVALAD